MQMGMAVDGWYYEEDGLAEWLWIWVDGYSYGYYEEDGLAGNGCGYG